MPEAWIGLGSNLGDRKEYLRAALTGLRRCGGLRRASSLFETEPVGLKEQGAFLNAVACVETALPPRILLDALLGIESEQGRTRRVRFGPRTLDLDLLFYGDAIVDEPGLRLPHPRLHERRFVLAPLCEAASNLVHPVLRLTAAELLARLDDPSRVALIESYPEWAAPGVY